MLLSPSFVANVLEVLRDGHISLDQVLDSLLQFGFFTVNRPAIESQFLCRVVAVAANEVFDGATLDEAGKRALAAHPTRLYYAQGVGFDLR